jgi:hypothetical protein
MRDTQVRSAMLCAYAVTYQSMIRISHNFSNDMFITVYLLSLYMNVIMQARKRVKINKPL